MDGYGLQDSFLQRWYILINTFHRLVHYLSWLKYQQKLAFLVLSSRIWCLSLRIFWRLVAWGKKFHKNTNDIMNHHCCHNCCYRHGMLKLQDVLDIQEVAGLNFRRKKVPQVLDLVTAGLQAKSWIQLKIRCPHCHVFNVEYSQCFQIVNLFLDKEYNHRLN